MGKSNHNKKTAFVLPRHSVALIFIFISCILVSLFGCASFHYLGSRTMPDETTKVGSVGSKVGGYGPLKINVTPTVDSPILKVYFPKQMIQKIRYETKTHQEEVFRRQPTRFKGKFLIMAGIAGATAFWTLELGLDNQSGPAGILALGGLAEVFYIFSTPRPPEEIKYVQIPGSNNVEITYKEETETITAAGETLVMDNRVSAKTDGNGVATFSVRNLVDFDKGIIISHPSSKAKYLISRIPKERTIQRDWVEAARRLELVVGAGEVIKIGVETVIKAIKPVVLITETIAGVVIHLLVEKFGTYTEQFYEWVVISTN